MTQPEISTEAPEFSLVLGGPLFDFFRRARLSGHTLEFAWRRVVVIAGVAWLPLLLLALIGGDAIGGPLQIPFLYDIEAQVRFLIALPILIVAEVIVHSRLVPMVRRFVERRLVVRAPRYVRAMSSIGFAPHPKRLALHLHLSLSLARASIIAALSSIRSRSCPWSLACCPFTF